MEKVIYLLTKIRDKANEIENQCMINNSSKISEYIENIINIIIKNETYIPSYNLLLENLINDFDQNLLKENSSEELYNKLYNFLGLNYNFNNVTSELINAIELEVPKDFGVEMEKIYFNQNYFIGIHGTSVDEETITKEIIPEGLLCNNGNSLNSTISNQNSTLNFSRFLRYYYKPNNIEYAIIVCIPKEELNQGLWKIDDNGIGNLNPKYIYGYYLSHINLLPNDKVKIIHNNNFLNNTNDYLYDTEDISIQKSV